MMILTVAFAPLLALFFDDSQLLPLTIALSPAFLIGSLAGVQGSVLQRSMTFRALAVVDTVGLVSANAVGVTMAIAGLGVWSLVADRTGRRDRPFSASVEDWRLAAELRDRSHRNQGALELRWASHRFQCRELLVGQR